MRARSTIDTNSRAAYDNGPCPAWMKTLEDKYKRLHMKIVFNTSNPRCRSTKPSGASSTVSGSGRHHRLSHRLRATAIRGPRTLSPCTTEGNFVESENKRPDSVVIKNAFEKHVKPEESEIEIATTRDSDAHHGEPQDSAELKSELSSEASSTTNMEYEKDTTKTSTHDRTHRKNPHSTKLVTSGGIVNTTKCDAKIQDSRPILMGSTDSTMVVHRDLKKPNSEYSPKKRRSKLFLKMSKEAQTAINETMSESKKESCKNGRENTFVLNNYHNVLRSSRTEISENATDTTVERSKSCDPRRNSISSTSSRDHTQTKLPDISSSRTTSSTKDMKKRNVILPGVGKYEIPVGVAREKTFQVTGAEYDIRYREVIRCERSDSITPPSDILEQAIMKCQEWLTKYAVYAKR